MNLHVMQSMETRAECSEIMLVPRCIVSPQSNKPVMGIVQDTLLGSRGFTKRDCFLRKDLVMNLVMHLDHFSGELPIPVRAQDPAPSRAPHWLRFLCHSICCGGHRGGSLRRAAPAGDGRGGSLRRAAPAGDGTPSARRVPTGERKRRFARRGACLQAVLKPEQLWTGKQIMSLFLPKMQLAKFSNGHPDDEEDELSVGDTRILIEDGELLTGMLDKKTLGTSGGGLVHVIFNEYGPRGARAFLGCHQRVINHWIVNRSYSIGIGDTIADAKTMDDIVATIDASKKEVKSLVERAQSAKLECQPGHTMLESFEKSVNQVLNKVRCHPDPHCACRRPRSCGG
jgi:DNA-directed RNA polymerase beta' subunit